MIEKINVLGLLGRSLKHSHSSMLFDDIFKRNSYLNFQYQNFEIQEISELFSIIMQNPDLVGLNVTIPFKSQILASLNHQDDTVVKTKVANTICIQRIDDKINLLGFNTDLLGFKNSIKPLLKPSHERALIIGNGATSKTVRIVLEEIGIDCLVACRKPNNEREIYIHQINNFVLQHHLLIVNTTPVGMFPDVDFFPAIPYEFINSNHLVYDVIYNPEKTSFLQKSEKQGAQIQNGKNMLLMQAEASWKIWKEENHW